MRNTKFTNKEEYIQYRKDWREDYMILSQTIRDHKLIIKYSNQACGKAVSMIDGDAFSYDNILKYFRYVNQNKKEDTQLQCLLDKYKNNTKRIHHYKKEAKGMMEELNNSKIEANRQYLASKNLVTI